MSQKWFGALSMHYGNPEEFGVILSGKQGTRTKISSELPIAWIMQRNLSKPLLIHKVKEMEMIYELCP